MPDTTDTLIRLRAGELGGIQRLELRGGLTEFPREVFGLADSLQVLDLSGNSLTTLPDDLPRLHQLRVIFCSNNPFTELPAVLGQCPQLQMIGFKSCQISKVPAAALPKNLRWLILTDNQLETLPPGIGHCSALQKLMLAGNRFRRLPPELAKCQAIELLRISANELHEMPDWVSSLPRLAWLACAGNPFSDAQAAAFPQATTMSIEWRDLSLQKMLGEGASGVISRAVRHRPGATPTTVAVKVFKGLVTSDGWPHSELAASLATGLHPHLIPVIGPLAGHPEGKAGLVMEFIPPDFSTLAGPPSLQSCTRDVYAPGTQFSLQKVLRIASSVASAAAHLHGRGLLHGDLYAHNLQCNADGDCLLGDMGAASFLPANGAASQALQRLEVRAFGCLLEELLELLAPCDDSEAGVETAFRALNALRDDCLQAPAQRPLFTAVAGRLGDLLSIQ